MPKLKTIHILHWNFAFWLIFQRNVFLKSKWWVSIGSGSPIRNQANTSSKVDPDQWRHMASIDSSKLNLFSAAHILQDMLYKIIHLYHDLFLYIPPPNVTLTLNMAWLQYLILVNHTIFALRECSADHVAEWREMRCMSSHLSASFHVVAFFRPITYDTRRRCIVNRQQNTCPSIFMEKVGIQRMVMWAAKYDYQHRHIKLRVWILFQDEKREIYTFSQFAWYGLWKYLYYSVWRLLCNLGSFSIYRCTSTNNK